MWIWTFDLLRVYLREWWKGSSIKCRMALTDHKRRESSIIILFLELLVVMMGPDSFSGCTWRGSNRERTDKCHEARWFCLLCQPCSKHQFWRSTTDIQCLVFYVNNTDTMVLTKYPKILETRHTFSFLKCISGPQRLWLLQKGAGINKNSGKTRQQHLFSTVYGLVCTRYCVYIALLNKTRSLPPVFSVCTILPHAFLKCCLERALCFTLFKSVHFIHVSAKL
jgi:hypothetical protein